MRTRILALALLGAVGVSAQAGTFYTVEASFTSFLVGPSYFENFDSISTAGSLPASWVAPGGNGYGFTATETLGGTLWSNGGSLSTNAADTTIRLTFSGGPVSAFSAYIANSDLAGLVAAGTTSLTFSNGETAQVNNTLSGDVFLGWAGDDASDTVTFVDVTSNFGAGTEWAQIDDVTVGAVPEPGTMAVLGLGLAAAARRRKKA